MVSNIIKGAFNFIRENYNEPYAWRRAIAQRNAHLQKAKRDECVDVMEEDWDNLFVLDACRTDLFEETINTESFSNYEHRTSLGSLTPEWTKNNFDDNRYGDTVYVSGNPWISKIAGNTFYDLVEVWTKSFDNRLWTVHADDIYKAAIGNYQEDKRLIVHFMQPHPPFIREVNGSLESALGHESAHWRPARIMEDSQKGVYNIWHALGRGELNHQSVWNAYKANLEYVYEYAIDLAMEIPGKTVITSDHGILMGERLRPIPIKAFGHPYGVRHKRLTEVPWAVVEGKRRDISATSQETENHDVNNEVVTDRLKKLGYAE